MVQQKGAALIVVLSMLTASLMLGLSSMQSSLIDERLAGNYKSASQAQMNAEKAVAELLGKLREDEFSPVAPPVELGWDEFSDFSNNHPVECLGYDGYKQACFLKIDDELGKEEGEYIVAMGAIDGDMALSEPIFVSIKREGVAVFDGITGCDSVSVTGGGRVTSYDSSLGSWNSLSQDSREYSGLLLNTEGSSSDVKLAGGVVVDGGVKVTGNLDVAGGSQVIGNAGVSGSLAVSGGSRVTGDVESGGGVKLNGGASILGNARSDGEIEAKGGSYVGGSAKEKEGAGYAGDYAGGECDYVSFGQDDGGGVTLSDEFSRLSESLDEDEALGKLGKNLGNYPFVDWSLSKEGLSAFDKTWNVQDWTDFARSQEATILGKERSIVRVDDFILKNGTLDVSGGDVVLFVDGDFVLGKGGSSYNIEDGSSLTVFVRGKVDISHGANMDDSKTFGSEGNPRLSIYSSGEDVSFTSSGKGVASVYAPYSDVSVNSGGQFFGSLRGKTLSVNGGGMVAYDIALKDDGPTSSGGGLEIKSWH
tara:strand:- start:1974 stop:3575 length:1602 start_codon:yes stop_codon:yes gene_type:complete